MSSTSSGEPFWKRGGFQSAEEAKTAFWDGLSKVPLCPRTLKEFNRRNSLVAKSATNSVRTITKRVTRSAARSATLVKSSSVQSRSIGNPTREQRRFARRGGPDLRDLRGYPKPVEAFYSGHSMPPKSNPHEPSSASTRETQTLHARKDAFGMHLIKHQIYPDAYEYIDGRTSVKPANWDEIQRRLVQPRLSLSPSKFSDGAFEKFSLKDKRALNENGVMTGAFTIIKGDMGIPSAGTIKFGNLTKLTDGTLVDAEPDIYDGALPEQLNDGVLQDVDSYIVPSTKTGVPILPNNFTEGKGPDGTDAEAKRQAMYDGALGARAMHHLQSYGQPEPIYDNNAYTISSTYSAGQLKLYTTHPTAPIETGSRPRYHMNQLRAFAMTDRTAIFREGATAYRNARDWAKEKRDEMIQAANQKASISQTLSLQTPDQSQSVTSTNRAATPESETSDVEAATPESDASDVEVAPSKRRRTSRSGNHVKIAPLNKSDRVLRSKGRAKPKQ